ncbi:flagellar motor switch protein FliM [Aliarcobacter lanthieri]|uniref:flagellar motor switch protein FliM n=1 Tax=Arcobacteraceae TaxID=2808963 RepID=UPI00047EA152|nr:MULTISPECIES: flagellar motor switch protein FliM [Arcobacteraceae]MBL3520343.1 flagellar motor switch protein FliM [Aliarcobacter lanthieri]QKF58368.1 flagellar motor switch C-ring protein FliM [Aliarcobacter lanthieri]RBQ27270.1 flagellar motor switch protein FliM [Arcobacter sp. CECT 9188]
MAEFLSQDEIDALLDIAEQGDDFDGTNPLDKFTAKEKNYSIYDFKKPNRVTLDQLKALTTMHDKMLREFTNDLSSMLRKVVDVKLTSIEQMTYGEFILSIPQVTSLSTLSMKPLDGKIVIECNPTISHKVIADLLGSGAVNTMDNLDRELTEIEIKVLEHFYKMFIKILYKTWSDVSSLNFRIESSDTNANAIQIVSDHDIVLLVVFEITIDEDSGFLSICYPISYIEPLLNKIVDKIFSEGKNKKLSRKQDIKTLISGSRMKIEPIMAETEMTTLEILNLKEGDVIVFNKNATSNDAIVYVNKKEKFSAACGISNNRKAIELKSNLDKEQQETLESLRIMREEREQKAKENAENIKKLLSERKSSSIPIG